MTPRPSPEPTGSPLHPQLALADAKARPSVQLASRTLDWCLLCSALAGLVSGSGPLIAIVSGGNIGLDKLEELRKQRAQA